MKVAALLIGLFLGHQATATRLEPGSEAPLFKVSRHDGGEFDLSSRKGKWTVLFFYPKAGTPGCTKQACAFRDGLKKITDQGADVFGISADEVSALEKFHLEQKLNFPLLSDPDEKVIKAYGTKMWGLPMSRRWTFIIDPDLKIRSVERDVDPVLDAAKVAAKLKELK